jgi:hypothetical protein
MSTIARPSIAEHRQTAIAAAREVYEPTVAGKGYYGVHGQSPIKHEQSTRRTLKYALGIKSSSPQPKKMISKAPLFSEFIFLRMAQ